MRNWKTQKMHLDALSPQYTRDRLYVGFSLNFPTRQTIHFFPFLICRGARVGLYVRQNVKFYISFGSNVTPYSLQTKYCDPSEPINMELNPCDRYDMWLIV